MILFENDLTVLLASIERVVKNGATNFVEIGVHEGGTAEKLISKIASMIGVEKFTYYGIDPVERNLHQAIKFINKPSHLAINNIPNSVDWVFVDGCHCAKCVIKDFTFYGNHLLPGGEICFHDASPLTQGRDPQDYPFMNNYHDVEAAKKGIAVRDVLDHIVRRHPLFQLVITSAHQEYGGVEVYKKMEANYEANRYRS